MEDQYVGKHCALLQCRQKDWTPITCKYCSKVYCTIHHSIESHRCPNFDGEMKKVFECPLCMKIIPQLSQHTPDQSFDIHMATDCTQLYRQQPQKKQVKCSECQTALKTVSIFDCRKCKKILCGKHRLPETHVCTR